MKQISIGILSFFMMLPAYGLETPKGAKLDIDQFKKEMSAKLTETEGDLKQLHARAREKKNELEKSAANDYELTRKRLSRELAELREDAARDITETKIKLSASIQDLHDKVQKMLKE